MSLLTKITEESENRKETAGADLEKYLRSNNFYAVRSYFLYYAKAEIWDSSCHPMMN